MELRPGDPFQVAPADATTAAFGGLDGSEDADRVMTTTVIVGKPAVAAKDDPELPALNKLAADKYWPVDIAYFDESKKGDGEELPEYRISFKLHANGITRDLTMDYGDFSMTGKLVNLALFDTAPQKTCDRREAPPVHGRLCGRGDLASRRPPLVPSPGRRRRRAASLRGNARHQALVLPGAAQDIRAALRHHRPRA